MACGKMCGTFSLTALPRVPVHSRCAHALRRLNARAKSHQDVLCHLYRVAQRRCVLLHEPRASRKRLLYLRDPCCLNRVECHSNLQHAACLSDPRDTPIQARDLQAPQRARCSGSPEVHLRFVRQGLLGHSAESVNSRGLRRAQRRVVLDVLVPAALGAIDPQHGEELATRETVPAQACPLRLGH
eukprot:518956-Rhodomonas_salina.1